MSGTADVIIVGAGPAGSALACSLAGLGWEVLVLERARFPRPKPCGECVNPGGVAALARLNLLDAVLRADPARIAGWEIHAEGATARGEYAVPSRGEGSVPCPPNHPAPSPGEYPAPSRAKHAAPSRGEYPAPSRGEYSAPSRGEYAAPSPGEYSAPSCGTPAPAMYEEEPGAGGLEPGALTAAALTAGELSQGQLTPGARDGAGRARPLHGSAPSTSCGLALSRPVLDAALAAEAARRGARIEEGVRVTDVAADGDSRRRTVTVTGTGPGGARMRHRARLLVGADGLRSVVARRTGLAGRPPRLRKLSLTCHLRGSGPQSRTGMLFLSDLGAFGLAPVRADAALWNGTLVVDSERFGRAVAADPLAFYRRALAALPVRWERGEPEIADGPWASGPFDRPSRRAVGDLCVLVGDAAGYYDPLTGQGIYRALRSAELASPVLDRALRAGRLSARDLAPYDRALRHALAPGRALQRAIELAITRPALRDWAIRRLAAAPEAADALIRVTGDAAAARTLLGRAVWLPLLVRSSPC